MRSVNPAFDRKAAAELFEGKPACMNGTEIRQLNAEDADEYQALFLGALQSAPTAFAADYGEESARSSDQIAERFRREVIFGAFVDGRLCAIATFLQQASPKRRHVGMIWNMYVAKSPIVPQPSRVTGKLEEIPRIRVADDSFRMQN
jgi:hypothetical protein